jgi:hypothetical protein
MDVLHRSKNGAYKIRSVAEEVKETAVKYRWGNSRLIVVASGAYPVEELAPRAQVEAQIEVARGLYGCVRIEKLLQRCLMRSRTESRAQVAVAFPQRHSP